MRPQALNRRWLLPAQLMAAACFAVPLMPLLLWAFADRWSWPAALPQAWGMRGWRDADRAGAVVALGRSAVLGVVVAAVAAPLGAMAGRALGWRLVRRPALVSLLLLAPVALPPFAVAMGLDVVLLRLRVPEPVAVVALLAVFALPYTTYILRAGYAAVDPALEDQARMLGASAGQAVWRASLPALRPAAVAAAAVAFLVGWSDYVVTVVVGGGQLVTLPVLLASAAAGTGNEPQVAVLALLGVAPLLATVALLGVVARR